LEQAFSTKRNADGSSANELWAAERQQLLPLPTAPFEVCRTQAVEVSSQSLVTVEGAWYSVPARWARLQATAHIGVDQVRIVCLGESVTHLRVRFGKRRVLYRHYLPELARKPKAVRQVAPELVAELGEPWVAVWRLLSPKTSVGSEYKLRIGLKHVGNVGVVRLNECRQRDKTVQEQNRGRSCSIVEKPCVQGIKPVSSTLDTLWVWCPTEAFGFSSCNVLTKSTSDRPQ
jgi:hypothetical protein